MAWAREFLQRCGVENPFLDAEVLLAHVAGLDRAGLYRESERPLSPEEARLFRQLVERRARKEPVAYLTGKKEFMGLEFTVTPAVLIPRPETELLVEKALALAGEISSRAAALRELPGAAPGFLIADVGTGSGAIAVSLARSLPAARIYALDCSPAALKVAKRNAQRYQVEDRVFFLAGDLLSPLLEAGLAGKIHLIAANLPYIPTAELSSLMPDVRCYEPLSALDGGPDGLFHYRRLIPQARRLLADPGWLLMEIGAGQGEEMGRLLAEEDWEYQIIHDLGGKQRVVLARRKRHA